MHLEMTRNNLSKIVTSIKGAASTKDVRPELSMMFLEVRGDNLIMEVNNGEVGAGAVLPLTTAHDDGAVLVPAAKFAEMVNEAKSDNIVIDAVIDTKITIALGNLNYDLPWMDPAKFPRWGASPSTDRVEIDASRLRDAIILSEFMVEPDGTNPNTGLLCYFTENDNLKIVGTDLHCMAICTIPVKHLEERTADVQEIVLIHAAAVMAKSILGDEGGVATLEFGSGQACISFGGIWVAGRLIEGKFPPWIKMDKYVSTDYASVDVKACQHALRMCKIVTDTITSGVLCTFSKNQLTLKSRGPNGAESVMVLPIMYDHDGDDVTVKINPKFLSEILSRSKVETIQISFGADIKKVPFYVSWRPEYKHFIQPLSV